MILWTRVTPALSATPGSGIGPDCAVEWEVAADPRFRRVVASGSTTTGAARDHTVKADVAGLAPGAWYLVPVPGCGRSFKHVDLDSHGFCALDATPERAQMDWYALTDRTVPDSAAHHSTSYAVTTGTQQIHQVQEPVR